MTGMDLVRAAVFPGTLAGTISAGAALVAVGADVFAAYALATFAAFFVVWGLEHALPFRLAWNRADGQRWHDLGHDLGHGLLGTGIGGALGDQVVRIGFGAAGLALLDLLRPLGAASPWPTGLPFAAQLALACLIADLGRYG